VVEVPDLSGGGGVTGFVGGEVRGVVGVAAVVGRSVAVAGEVVDPDPPGSAGVSPHPASTRAPQSRDMDRRRRGIPL
jgi:hypothetical protein